MPLKDKNLEIVDPKKQLLLHGYKKYFHSFKKLFDLNKLPNVILLSGQKGLGKCTFAYHFINYVLSKNQKNNYSLKNFQIDENNSSYKQIQNNVHPDFFLLDSINSGENIKIDQIRHLLKFLNKSSLSEKEKIVLIDNAEFLNINSSNSLLKALEEQNKKTFFFIIHNNSKKILDTIRSRCIEFKLHFTQDEKNTIFKRITENYNLTFSNNYINKLFLFDTPGNLLKQISDLEGEEFDRDNDNLSCINFFIKKFSIKKEPYLLELISLLIENFYNELSLNDIKNFNYYYSNKKKITYLINDYKNFNLDKKNLIISIDGILKNEFSFS